MTCIFGNADQWRRAHLFEGKNGQVAEIMRLEEEFGTTIKRDKSIRQLIRTSKAEAPRGEWYRFAGRTDGTDSLEGMFVGENVVGLNGKYGKDAYYESLCNNDEDTGPT